MDRVFVYGTLKRGEPNEFMMKDPRLGAVKFLTSAVTVRMFPLVIASIYNVPYLLLKPGFGNRIVGDVFEVENLDALDEFEGYPRYYTRLEEEVELPNGDIMKTWIYALHEFKPDLLERPMISNYCSKSLNELAFKSEALKDLGYSHMVEVKDWK